MGGRTASGTSDREVHRRRFRRSRTGGRAGVLVLEKSDLIGGTSAMSGAGTWVPDNRHMLGAGFDDSQDQALAYLRATAPARWQEQEDELWQAFAADAPAMLAFLEAHTPLRFELVAPRRSAPAPRSALASPWGYICDQGLLRENA